MARVRGESNAWGFRSGGQGAEEKTVRLPAVIFEHSPDGEDWSLGWGSTAPRRACGFLQVPVQLKGGGGARGREVFKRLSRQSDYGSHVTEVACSLAVVRAAAW